MKQCNDKEFVVYCHTNNINNKKYIGITCQSISQRFRNGKGYKSCPHFNNAIKLYGWDNFSHEILFSGLSQDEAKEKEIELIKKYKTRNPKYGYNMTPGGEGYCGKDNPWFGKHHSEETKQRLRELNTGLKRSEETKRKLSEAFKGRVFSEETKQKMRGKRPNISGKNHPKYGKKLSEEMIKKLVAASKTKEAIEKMKKNKTWYSGAKNPHAKRVMCIETGVVYGTLNDASKGTNCSCGKISRVCNGWQETVNNLHFKFV